MILCKDFKVSKNKAIEMALHLEKKSRHWFILEAEWTRQCCHSGTRFAAGTGWAWFEISFYDKRHWDYEKECWEETGKDEEHRAV